MGDRQEGKTIRKTDPIGDWVSLYVIETNPESLLLVLMEVVKAGPECKYVKPGDIVALKNLEFFVRESDIVLLVERDE